MKNPLNRRVLRKISSEKIKYIMLIIFVLLIIGFSSGSISCISNLKNTYNNVPKVYNTEDGHFVMNKKLSDDYIREIEKKEDVKIKDSFYFEKTITKKIKGKNLGTARIFLADDREKINKICLLKGEMPKTKTDIILDRLYCENNSLEIGDTVFLSGEKFLITGMTAFPDYSCLYYDNEDLMFDAKNFLIGAVSSSGFSRLNKGRTFYNYVWTYNYKPTTDIEKKKLSEELMKDLFKISMVSENQIKTFLPSFFNKAITFADNDFDGDKSITVVFLYVLIIIMAFIFSVEISGDITRDAKNIGTIKTMGFSRREIINHYIAIPLIVIIISGLLGNVLGYTFFESWIESKYLGSYSLTKTTRSFSLEAFVLTTVIPVIIVYIITFIIINYKLKLSPLEFLNEDLSKRKNYRSTDLSGSFYTRFIKRVLIDNKFIYVILFIGVFLANWMMFYGTMIEPMLDHHQEEVSKKMISKYRYIVEPETNVFGGEKFTVVTFKTNIKGRIKEDVTVYGISKNSKYFDKKIKKAIDNNKALVSTSMKEKFNLEKGDVFELKESYGDKKYKFTTYDVIDQPEGVNVYLSREKLNELIGEKKDFYNGCYSEKKLPIKEKDILTVITRKTLIKSTSQLNRSMKDFFFLMKLVAIAIYVLVIYLLSKEIIEKNRKDISLSKILGYSDREIKELYIIPTRIAFVFSLIASMPIGIKLAEESFRLGMKKMNGWLSFYAPPSVYFYLFITGMATYFVVEYGIYKKINKVLMNEVLSDE